MFPGQLHVRVCTGLSDGVDNVLDNRSKMVCRKVHVVYREVLVFFLVCGKDSRCGLAL